MRLLCRIYIEKKNDVFKLCVQNFRLLSSDETEEQRGGQKQPFQEEGGRNRDLRSETQVGSDLRTVEEGNQTHSDRESIIITYQVRSIYYY